MKKILLSILCISLYACQESKSAEPEITQEEVDKQDKVVAQGFGNTRWNSDKVRKLLDTLIK